MFVVDLWKKDTSIKSFCYKPAYSILQRCTVYWNTVLSGFYILDKEMQEPLILYPLYCKIMHLKAKTKFMHLVASNSDFVSTDVILNQHPWY